MRKIFLSTVILAIIVFVSCLHPLMVYKSMPNLSMINDSIDLRVSEGKLERLRIYIHFAFQLQIDNKSCFPVYINKQSGKLICKYANVTIPYTFDYFLSDTVIEPHSEKKIHLAFERENMSNVLDFPKEYDKHKKEIREMKEMRENHHFVMNIDFIIGDSIVKKEIIFRPK